MGYTQTKLEELEQRVEALEQAGLRLNYVVGEIPHGVIDGVNTTFTTENQFESESPEVFINGLRQEPSLYLEVDNQSIQFTEAPSIEDIEDPEEVNTIVINYVILDES